MCSEPLRPCPQGNRRNLWLRREVDRIRLCECALAEVLKDPRRATATAAGPLYPRRKANNEYPPKSLEVFQENNLQQNRGAIGFRHQYRRRGKIALAKQS